MAAARDSPRAENLGEARFGGRPRGAARAEIRRSDFSRFTIDPLQAPEQKRLLS